MRPYRAFLYLIAAPVAGDADFGAAMAEGPSGMADQMPPIRKAWAKALLARLNQVMNIPAGHALGLAHLRAASFSDTATPHFLLPHVEQHHRAVAAHIPGLWRDTPD